MNHSTKTQLVQFEEVALEVRLDAKHGWLISTKDMAAGFGVTVQAINAQFSRNNDEFVEGKHYISVVMQQNVVNATRTVKHWTQRGVIRFGFLLRSERARRFRNFSEDLVFGYMVRKLPYAIEPRCKVCSSGLREQIDLMLLGEARHPDGERYRLTHIAAWARAQGLEVSQEAVARHHRKHLGSVEPVQDAQATNPNSGLESLPDIQGMVREEAKRQLKTLLEQFVERL